MAQHDSFHLVPVGKQFTVDAWHAKADGTALILTKTTDTAAKDDEGRVWDFSQSMGLQCFER
jgi:hypothetical protein